MVTTVWQLFKITAPGLLLTAKWLALVAAAWSQTFPNFLLAQCLCQVRFGLMGASLVGVSE